MVVPAMCSAAKITLAALPMNRPSTTSAASRRAERQRLVGHARASVGPSGPASARLRPTARSSRTRPAT